MQAILKTGIPLLANRVKKNETNELKENITTQAAGEASGEPRASVATPLSVMIWTVRGRRRLRHVDGRRRLHITAVLIIGAWRVGLLLRRIALRRVVVGVVVSLGAGVSGGRGWGRGSLRLCQSMDFS